MTTLGAFERTSVAFLVAVSFAAFGCSPGASGGTSGGLATGSRCPACGANQTCELNANGDAVCACLMGFSSCTSSDGGLACVDELTGISGHMDIQIVEGKHSYELEYELGGQS